MQTIIIPTDFSSAADNAMHYGAQLAKDLGAEILLLHVYMVPVTMNDMPVLMVTADELKGGADEGLMRCKTELETAYPGIIIKCDSRLGDVVDELEDICNNINPLLVVMGTHGSSGIEQIFFGSSTVSAIKNLNHPLIAVPLQYTYQKIETIVLAADMQPASDKAVQHIMRIVQMLHSRVEVVHVIEKGDEGAQPPLVQQLQPLSPSYHTIVDDDISHGIQTYLQHLNSALLMLLPHQHGWFQSLFSKTHTKEIIKNTQLPVLCIKA